MALGKSTRRADHEVNTFIETGAAGGEQAKEKKTRDVVEREVTKTFRLPEESRARFESPCGKGDQGIKTRTSQALCAAHGQPPMRVGAGRRP